MAPSRSENHNRSESPATVYVPREEFRTGRLDAHDVAWGRRGLYLANTRYNCIARVPSKKRFVHCWRPPFIENVTAKDRCHLNGVGLDDGRLAMATAFCESDSPGSWRAQNRFTGGVLIDIPGNQIAARGLCMPHSPRRYANRWWVCNSGHGTLTVFNSETSSCQAFCALPGFTRGLCFVGDYALVGLSKIRHKHILDAPPVREQHQRLLAGVALVDLRSARHVGTLEFVRGGREVFDVAFLPDVRTPSLKMFPDPEK